MISMEISNEEQTSDIGENTRDTSTDTINKFTKFMTAHVAKKGEIYTHTTVGPPWKTYNIPNEEYTEFLKLYTGVVGRGKLHLTEKPREVGPLLIDIDMKFNNEHSDRMYNHDDIKNVINAVNKELIKYFKVKNSNLRSFVSEKPKPTFEQKNNQYKDGFHIVYPYIGVPVNMRYMIMHEVENNIKNSGVFDHLPFINDYNDVFDKCVVNNNGWMMYGSSKHKGQLYSITKIYKYSSDGLKEDKISKYKNELPAILSNRKFSTDDVQEIKSSVNKTQLNVKLARIDEKYGAKKVKTVTTDIDDEPEFIDDESEEHDEPLETPKVKGKKLSDRDMAVELVKIMNRTRADSYTDWINLGWALHNVDTSLLSTWKTFSKQCKNKYDSRKCDDVWSKARDTGFSISSIHKWARDDNPEQYAKLMRDSINPLFEEAVSGMESDVAKIVYELYKHIYKCTDIKTNAWYEYKVHRWEAVPEGYTLNMRLSDVLTKDFAYLSSMYYAKMANSEGIEQDNNQKKAENIGKIINKLKRTSFKNCVMDECKRLFFDSTFEEKLDENRDLIGFENGVYDLKHNIFREGTPDDYLTMSVGYDYKKFSMGDPSVTKIEEFFASVMVEMDMREYILTLLSSYLDGHNKQQKFIIWTGCGANGKSVTVDFFSETIGEYYDVLPVTVLTKKRGSSSSATPEFERMKGKRFVVFQEPEGDDKINVGQMKELTGGDWLYARGLYKNPIRYKPQFKLILTCNKLPHIPSNDRGTWRRLRVSPWESEFVEVDNKGLYEGKTLKKNQFPKNYNISDELKEHKQAFMWLLINRYYILYKSACENNNKMNEPDKVLMFTKKYQKSSDVYLEFITQNIVFTKNSKDRISYTTLYFEFKNWFKDAYATSMCPAKKDVEEYLDNNSQTYTCRRGFLYYADFYDPDTDQHNDLEDTV